MQNFGIINETFKDILIESIGVKDSKSKVMFNKYVKALKSSNILRAQYHIYNKIENKIESDKIKSLDYVRESITLLKNLGVNNIIKENTKLVNFLTKNGYGVSEADYPYKKLHESIDKLITTKKSSKNLDTILESAYFISDFMSNNTLIIKEETDNTFFSNKAVGSMMVEKFNKKYEGLSETEVKVFKTIIAGTDDDKEKLHIGMVIECVELVDKQLKECSIDEKDKLLQVKDKLLRLKYIKEDFASEITKIINLKNKLI